MIIIIIIIIIIITIIIIIIMTIYIAPEHTIAAIIKALTQYTY